MTHSPFPSATIYADVLLPLAFGDRLTYLLPAELQESAQVGCRVVVPLGERKWYTGIIARLHTETPPEGLQVKEVLELIDQQPTVTQAQLLMWQWMAEYYMCTPGEVMKAALPSGLRPESETMIRLSPDGETADAVLSPREQTIVTALREGRAADVATLEKELAVRRLFSTIRRMLETGILEVHETMSASFRPRTETHIRLCPAWQGDEGRQNGLLDSLRRSPRQEELVLALLDEEAGNGLPKKELLRRTQGSEAALKALRDKGIVEAFPVEVERLRPTEGAVTHPASPLSEAQQEAMDAIVREWETHDVCLLHGVTSSGKTEVYTHLIERELAAGRQVLYLLPEIALTTQITARLGRIFGGGMGVYHSKFPDAERVELWQRQLTERAFPLVLGVRSSIFLPFRNLGLIIVDEEHETSYKQQDPAPRYHARDAALVLARQTGAKVLLGTATPAVETYHNATRGGKYGLVTLTSRFGDVMLPEIVVEDTAELRRKKLMKTPFSPRLIDEMCLAMERGQQVILFQNRRGYAPVLECRTCGWTPRCTACDVSLTYHQRLGKLVCHYCGAAYDVPHQCPNCEDTELRDRGYGTEKIEEAVHALIPEARTARMDLDTTRSRTAYERIIHDFQEGRTDILIGTQMVTKGLDFDRVSVVGIVSADQMLNRPDFRAFERAFQMMAQVAGRAGRRGSRGLVILQTGQPHLPVIRQVVENDYPALFRSQIEERALFRFPPFIRIIDIYLRHRDENVCSHAAEALATLLRPHFGNDLLGPDKPVVARIQRMYIRKILLKVDPQLPVSGVRRTLLAARDVLCAMANYKGCRVIFDVDPA